MNRILWAIWLALILPGSAQEMRGLLEVIIQPRPGCTKSLACYHGLCGHRPGVLLQRREGAVRLWPGAGRSLQSLRSFHGRQVVVHLRPRPPRTHGPGEQHPQAEKRALEYDILEIRLARPSGLQRRK